MKLASRFFQPFSSIAVLLDDRSSKMKDLARLRSLTFTPIYYFGFVFGVFPYKYDKNVLYPNGNSNGEFIFGSKMFNMFYQENYPFIDDAFTKSTAGLLFCGIFMTVHAYGIGFTAYESYSAIKQYGSCFEELCSMHVCRNVCAHFIILWMNCLANLTSTCTVLFLRWKNTIRCINEANNLLKKSTYDYKFALSHWIVILFMTVHVTAFVLHWRNSGFNPIFLYTYMPLHLTQCLPIVTENVVSVLLLIIENCYKSINTKIEEMSDRRYFLNGEITATLETLRKYHWSVTDMTELVSNTFSLDFTIVGVTSTIRFIYFLFITLQYAARKSVINNDGGLMLPSYDAVIFFISVVGKFVYLCARCDKVVLQVRWRL